MTIHASKVSLDDAADRIIPESEARRLLERIMKFARGGGDSAVSMTCWWGGELRWARNSASLASDRRNTRILVVRRIGNAFGKISTNQTDDVSLEAAVRAAERVAQFASSFSRVVNDERVPSPVFTMPAPKIWSDVTARVTAEQRAALVRTLTAQADEHGMLSAGYMDMHLGVRVELDPSGGAMLDRGHGEWTRDIRYDRFSRAYCSMTVRHPKGVGSGWAGNVNYDWSAIDSAALATRAFDKCIKSLNPVAIEPGRYTVVLEPQAVCDLVGMCFERGNAFDRMAPEVERRGPVFLGGDPSIRKNRSKLGLKIVDERITLLHDPMDPRLGVLPVPDARRVVWVDRGVLTSLDYPRDYALLNGFGRSHSGGGGGWFMSGGETSIDEMIRTTKRGLLVTRFSNINLLDSASVLMSGVTRDGLWLIENGTITRAVKNLRFTESPLFVLNQIEQLGVPIPTIWLGGGETLAPAVVPPIKARDFSFTATSDAI